MPNINQATRYLFFTGKGGVGKTSLSCATAVALADGGSKVLLVSTDPASNLDDVLNLPIKAQPTEIREVPGLWAANLDPEAAAAAYREKMVGPYRGLLPESAISNMEEQFAGACTVEIAAFDEFARLLGDPKATKGFDHVIFDTAPTGHTLRLLSLPNAWQDFISTSQHGTSCLGPLAGLEQQREIYQQTINALADAALTTLVLVSRPEPAALAEAARTSIELGGLGVNNQQLWLNGAFEAQDRSDPTALALEERGRAALTFLPPPLSGMPQETFRLLPSNLVGVAALRQLFAQPAELTAAPVPGVAREALPQPLSNLVDELAIPGHGVIMTMGKGGVGKTAVASAIAIELASRGHQVLLTTTDPADHVAATVAEGLPGLRVARIDPKAEVAAYEQEVLATAGKNLSPEDRAFLEEDLRSPCTEEIAVFRAFARAIAQGQEGFVVLDTAPTGHTILLLDAANSYHREVGKRSDQIPEEVRQLLPRLRDPMYVKMLLVTLPEITPVAEAERLQADLRRAEIEPAAWVINQSLLASGTTDPLLSHKAAHERAIIERVHKQLAKQTYLIPWVTYEPVGVKALQDLTLA